MEQTLFPAKNKQSDHRRHGIAKTCRNCCTADSHVKSGNEHIVKRHIQDASSHGAHQGKIGLFTGNHIEREVVHQKNRHGENQIAA